MIYMALLSVLKRWHFGDGMLIREIAGHTGLSRNTVRKHLASGELEPRYRRPKVPSKLGDYEQTLTSGLHHEIKCPRIQRRTDKRPHQSSIQMLGHNWMRSNNERMAVAAQDMT